MIRKLRIKFVCINMLIITLMLCVILGLVMHFTSQTLEMQSVNMMRRIAAEPFQHGDLGGTPAELRLPFFTVRIGPHGELITAGGGYFDLSDREFLQQIVDAANASGAETGVLEAYGLRYCRVGQRIVFADITSEQTTLRSLLYTCLGIGAAGLGAFWIISILLARWAVKPVEHAWEQQRQFVADASHELKTPLAVIMANAELMQDEAVEPEKKRAFAGRILTVSYQMRTLVESLLDMARVDNGSVKPAQTPVDLSQLVCDAVLSVQLLYEEQGMGLENRIEENIRIKGSEQHLYQVMDVLLDNALKYSTPGGPVRVSLTRKGGSCLLRVAGPGGAITPEDLKNIFKRFYRIDKARSMDGSTGLGLSIAESIVTAHKGKIWAESREGINSFFVRLPTV